MHANPRKFRRSAKGGISRPAQMLLLETAILLAALGVFVFYFTNVNTVSCRRGETEQVDCTISSRMLGFIPLRNVSVAAVIAAYVDDECPTPNDCSYRVQIYGADGSESMEEQYTPGYTVKKQIADTLNDFLSDTTRQNVEVKTAVQPAVLAGGALIFVTFFVYLSYSFWRLRHPAGSPKPPAQPNP